MQEQQTARWLITPSLPLYTYGLACIRLVPIGFLLVCVRVMEVDYHVAVVAVRCLGVWHGPVPVVTTALIVRAVTRR
jgi:hypothetical protein